MSAPRNARSIGTGRGYDYLGQTVPSVTTILNAIAKPALLHWYAKMASAEALSAIRAVPTTRDVLARLAEEQWLAHEATATHQTRHKKTCDFKVDALQWLAGAPTRTRDTAGKRGTDVHEAAEKDSALDDVPVNAQKAYGSYQRWVQAFDPVILAKEFQVFNAEVGYGGSGDVIADVFMPPYDRRYTTVIDLKSSGSVYHETRLQLAAYRYGKLCVVDDNVDLLGTAALGQIERAAILHLTDEGYTFWEVQAGPAEFDVFKNVLSTFHFLAANERTDVGVVIQPATEAAA